MSRPLRVFLGAFGDPGHAFPMLALGARLVTRGHDVTLETWVKWREDVERAGMRFAAAPEYQVFPTREKPLKPYAAAVRAAREIQPFVASFGPDVAVGKRRSLAGPQPEMRDAGLLRPERRGFDGLLTRHSALAPASSRLQS